ncbi:DUF2188 domain-containing protein [Kocuria sabuli]|uniref:DUF2188 domain-containing protein n=1 Tax=Kocuria sabuli TaxID=3071448 RepID=UPI0034D53C59
MPLIRSVGGTGVQAQGPITGACARRRRGEHARGHHPTRARPSRSSPHAEAFDLELRHVRRNAACSVRNLSDGIFRPSWAPIPAERRTTVPDPKDRIITPCPSGCWEVKAPGATRAGLHASSRSEAMQWAWNITRGTGGQVIAYWSDGSSACAPTAPERPANATTAPPEPREDLAA